MADLINFTREARTVTGAGVCRDDEVLDVAGYGAMQLVLRGLVFDTGGALTVRLETAMGTKSDDWISLGVFTPVTADAPLDARRFDGLLRYVRWRVDAITGAKATFMLSGMISG